MTSWPVSGDEKGSCIMLDMASQSLVSRNKALLRGSLTSHYTPWKIHMFNQQKWRFGPDVHFQLGDF